MPIIAAILFGIGILAIADTSKLPWFLQIIRAGLMIALRWVFKIGIVLGIISLCYWGYDSYDKHKKQQAERAAWVADSTAWVKRPMPEYGSDEYSKWASFNPEKAEAYEAKLEQEIQKENDKQQQENERSSQLAQRQRQEFIFGSWGRIDTKPGDSEDLGVYTFRKNKTFYTISQQYQAEKGTYKIDYSRNILYVYYDSGQSESINIADFDSDKIEGTHEQHEDTKVSFLKRPRIVPEEVTELEAEPEQVKVNDSFIREYPDHSKDNQLTNAKPLRQH